MIVGDSEGPSPEGRFPGIELMGFLDHSDEYVVNQVFGIRSLHHPGKKDVQFLGIPLIKFVDSVSISCLEEGQELLVRLPNHGVIIISDFSAGFNRGIGLQFREKGKKDLPA